MDDGPNRSRARHPVTLIACAAAVAAIAWATSARSHSWYEARCCHDQDCAAIPADRLTYTAAGPRLVLYPGEHMMVREPVVLPVERDMIRPSQDGDIHACIQRRAPGVYRLICLYVPGMT